MSYESPIKLFHRLSSDWFIEHLRDETDNLICRAVANADVQVDKAELMKALEYDRGQYEKGYADGLVAGREKWMQKWIRLHRTLFRLMTENPETFTYNTIQFILDCMDRIDKDIEEEGSDHD